MTYILHTCKLVEKMFNNTDRLILMFIKEEHPKKFKIMMEDEKLARDGRLLRFNKDGSINTKYFTEDLEIKTINIKALKKTFKEYKDIINLEETL